MKVRRILFAGLMGLSISACSKVSNQLNTPRLVCGDLIEPGNDFYRIQTPSGQYIENADIELINPETGDKNPSPKLTAKGCVQIGPDENWLVKAKGKPWVTLLAKRPESENGVLKLTAVEKQQVNFKCQDTLRVSRDLTFDQFLDASKVAFPDAMFVSFEEEKNSQKKTFALSTAKQQKLFDADSPDGSYVLKFQIIDRVNDISSDYSCSVVLDNEPPLVELSYGPDKVMNWQGFSFRSINRSQRLSFAVRMEPNDVSYVEYCASSFREFQAFRTALELPFQSHQCANPKRTSDLLSNITERNEDFWIIVHRAVDLAGNTSDWSAPFPFLYLHDKEFNQLETLTNNDQINGLMSNSGGPKSVLLGLLDGMRIRDTVLTTDLERQLATAMIDKAFIFSLNRMPYFVEAKRLEIPDDFANLAGVSIDGKYFLTQAPGDGTIRQWDLIRGRPTGKVISIPGGYAATAISPDGKTLLTANFTSGVALWDIESFAPLSPFVSLESFGPSARLMGGLSFSSDGKQFVVACLDSRLQVWDTKTLKPISPILGTARSILQASAGPLILGNGDILAVDEQGRVILRNRDKEYLEPSFFDVIPLGFEGMPANFFLVPEDKSILVFGDSLRTRPQYWEVNQTAAGPELKAKDDPIDAWKNLTQPRLSKDGKLLAAIQDETTIRLYDRKTKRLLQADFPTGLIDFQKPDFSPDASKLISLADNAYASIWVKAPTLDDITVDSRLPEELSPILYTSVRLSPDQSRLAVGTANETVSVYTRGADGRFQSPQVFTSQRPYLSFNSLSISPDNRLLAAGGDDGITRIYNLESGKLLSSLPQVTTPGFYIKTLEFLDATSVALADKDKFKVFDAESGTLLREVPVQSDLTLFALFDHNRKAALVSDRTLRIWDLEKAIPIGEPLPMDRQVLAMAIDEQEQYLAVGIATNPPTIKVIHLPSRTAIGSALKGHRGGISSLLFLKGGKLVSGSDDRTIKIWDIFRSELIVNLTRHTDYVFDLSPGEDDMSFYSASADGTIRRWSLDFDSVLRKVCETLADYLDDDLPYCQSGQ